MRPSPSPQVSLEYGPSLSLDDARKVALAAEAEAKRNGFPMAIAIADVSGELVLLVRMDHTQFGSIEIAHHKARSAARLRRPTKVFQDGLEQPGGTRALSIDVCAIEGGLPLLREGRVVGAIGVSGMLPANDSQVAQAGVLAFG